MKTSEELAKWKTPSVAIRERLHIAARAQAQAEYEGDERAFSTLVCRLIAEHLHATDTEEWVFYKRIKGQLGKSTWDVQSVQRCNLPEVTDLDDSPVVIT